MLRIIAGTDLFDKTEPYILLSVITIVIIFAAPISSKISGPLGRGYLLSNNFCDGDFNPLLGTHPLTLIGGWLLITAGWIIILKSKHHN